MRKFLIAAIFAAGSVVSAQDEPFKQGDALKAQIDSDCADGCVVFSRERAAEFEEHLGKIIGRREMEAYKAGMQAQKAARASLI